MPETEPKILPASDRRRTPSMEGGGETAAVAVYPPDSNASEFEWKVSLTSVASTGALSVLPGTDRTISVIEGNGLNIAVEGKPPVVLTPRSEPFAFPADAPATVSLVEGPVVVLNVMSRRQHWRHRVERRHLEGQHHLDAPGGVTILLSLGNLRVDAGHHAVELRRQDAILVEEVVLLTTDIPVEAYLIRFTRV